MKISFENALGIHADALALRSRRLEVLASNLVNADTPGYKARDIDFRTALDEAASTAKAGQLQTTRAGHIGSGSGISNSNFEVQYRVPTQPSTDGNTVEAEVEQAEFSRNASQYQVSLQFLSGRFSGLRRAITGE